jgi:hypothetical protein
MTADVRSCMTTSAFSNVPVRFGYPVDGITFKKLQILPNQITYELGVQGGNSCSYASEVSHSLRRKHKSPARAATDGDLFIPGHVSIEYIVSNHIMFLDPSS